MRRLLDRLLNRATEQVTGSITVWKAAALFHHVNGEFAKVCIRVTGKKGTAQN